MKIALCFPRTLNELHGVWPPLGIVYLGTVLKQNGYEIKLFDSSFDGTLEKMKQSLKDYSPDIVGMTALTSLFENVKEIAEFSKKLGSIVIVGGPHATIASEDCLKNEYIDFAVMGEAEETIVDLIKTIEKKEDLKNVKGIGFKENGKIIINNPRNPIKNLDKIPFPERDLLPTFHEYIKNGATNIFAIRGCPNKCSFCYPMIPRLFGQMIRFRTPKNILDEIKLIQEKYKIDEFFFVDDTFALSKPWLKEFADEIKKQNVKIKYLANARCNTFDEEMAQILKESGCFYVAFGVESGSQKILDTLQKGITVEQIINSFIICKKYKLRTHAYLMVGSPGETKETLHETEVLLDKIKPDTLDFNLTTPLFGTALYDYCKDKNLLNLKSFLHQDYKGYFENITPVVLSDLTLEDIQSFIKKMLKKRRFKTLMSKGIEMSKEFITHPTPSNLQKIIWRYKIYKRMRHMFG